MLWLSIGSNSYESLLSPDSSLDFFHGLRAIFPFVAASLAAVVILYQYFRMNHRGFSLVSPIGLVVVYGLVGLIATILSLDAWVAFRWGIMYLSVPLVLWAIAWRADALDRIYLLLNISWLGIILISLALFAVAMIYLDIFDLIKDPRLYLECNSGNWYDLTSGSLRDTGVGRYAAIAGIVAIGGLWERKWWHISALVIVLSVTLLLFTGARGAMGGFAVAAPFAGLLFGGKKALWAGLLALALFVPLFWVTGSNTVFYEHCILSGNPTPDTTAKIGEKDLSSQISESAVIPTAIALTPDPTQSASKDATQSASPKRLEPTRISPTMAPDQPIHIPPTKVPDKPPEFFTFTGRTSVWAESVDLINDSPLLGYGFHADRIMLKAHVHNSVIHALLQTGVIGTIPFLAAMIFAWLLLVKILRIRDQLLPRHQRLVIQSGAVLAFLTVRSFPESTGAFFGVDWLILAPILLYLHMVYSDRNASQNSKN